MKLQLRTEKGSKIRSKNLTPGVLYGKGMKSASVQVDSNEFMKMYNAKGTSKTFDVEFEGEKLIVYIKDTHSNYENRSVKTHFDLIRVSKDDTMSSKVHLAFLNHEVLEKKGLIVNSVMNEIDVEYAVGMGISRLELDVAELKEFDVLRVSDIIPPEGVTIVSDMGSVVVSIATPREEEEEVSDEDAVEAPLEVESIKQSNE